MTSKARLEQYIKEDKVYNDWLNENTSYVSNFDRFCIQHCEDIKCLLEENEKLKQWDNNKDSRNSRQRVANAKLLKENLELREKLDKYENPEDMTLMMMWCTEKVKDENQELKKKYENAVADYETTMFEKEQLNSLVNSCQEAIRQLKKQIEENKDNYNCLLKQKEQFEYIMSKQVDYQGQQKEFILYLRHLSNWYSADGVKQGMVNEILQKYKEIIGDDK